MKSSKSIAKIIVSSIILLLTLTAWVLLFFISWKIALCIFAIQLGENKRLCQDYISKKEIIKIFNELNELDKFNDSKEPNIRRTFQEKIEELKSNKIKTK